MGQRLRPRPLRASRRTAPTRSLRTSRGPRAGPHVAPEARSVKKEKKRRRDSNPGLAIAKSRVLTTRPARQEHTTGLLSGGGYRWGYRRVDKWGDRWDACPTHLCKNVQNRIRGLYRDMFFPRAPTGHAQLLNVKPFEF